MIDHFSRSPSLIRARQQRGSIAPFMILALSGVLLATAYALDTSRMTDSASQVKRATDAAAMAVGNARLSSGEKSLDKLKVIAEGYVLNNLGMDSSLGEQISRENITLSESSVSVDDQTRVRYRVDVDFHADPELLGGARQELQVHSTVEVLPSALEVALVLPNTLSEDASNLAVLRRLGNAFAQELISDRDDAWLSLVPYSQAVSVYDAEHPTRIRQWAASGALNPVELSSLFSSGYGSLADRRMPDRRANLLCLYRGLNQGENYFWDQAPAGQFNVYYRADLPENDTVYGITPYTISWVGPNPTFGQASGANDTRYLIADRGCPSAPLLPLTNDLDKIEERLDAMSTRFNVNYAIAMGWGAMALAPAFRGSSGWGAEDDLPKDFKDDGGDSYKAIVMLVNSSDQDWFDSDAYNRYVGETTDGCPSDGSTCSNEALITRRFANLCSSLRERDVRVFLIVVGNDESEDSDDDDGSMSDASGFRRIAGAGLSSCAVESDDLTYYNGRDFADAEDRIQDRLDKINEELLQASAYVRLIE
ncbi:TadE/TadG family type IV pilus assembly protein [Pseudomonas sp. LRF_L74]|uniref:TadE/TadG family type IV pilus assembly protein n=1 Tax=Pseudomonas sp. LRF_L74 TaxID=3369422 RepID=UPI003F5EF8C2